MNSCQKQCLRTSRKRDKAGRERDRQRQKETERERAPAASHLSQRTCLVLFSEANPSSSSAARATNAYFHARLVFGFPLNFRLYQEYRHSPQRDLNARWMTFGSTSCACALVFVRVCTCACVCVYGCVWGCEVCWCAFCHPRQVTTRWVVPHFFCWFADDWTPPACPPPQVRPVQGEKHAPDAGGVEPTIEGAHSSWRPQAKGPSVG